MTQISNQGAYTTLQTDGNPTTAGQQPTYTAIPNTDLAMTKMVDNGNPTEAGTVVYTVVVTNAGSTTAANVTVADVLPAGLTQASSNATAGSYTNPTVSLGSEEGLPVLSKVESTGAWLPNKVFMPLVASQQ